MHATATDRGRLSLDEATPLPTTPTLTAMPPPLDRSESASSSTSTNASMLLSVAPTPRLQPFMINTTNTSTTSPTSTPTPTPTPGRGKRLPRRMLEELRSRAHRSPPHRDNTTATAPVPPALVLNAPSDRDLSTDAESSTIDDDATTTSPRDQFDVPHANANANARSKGCAICERAFTVFHMKHTCKLCRRKICDDCSRTRRKLNRRLERSKGSRLCDQCVTKLAEEPDGALLAADRLDGDNLGKDLLAEYPALAAIRESDKEDQDVTHCVRRASLNSVIETAESLKHAASRLAEGLTEPRPTNLRLRHWYFLGGLSCLLLLHIVRIRIVLPNVAIVLVLTKWLDALFSLRVMVVCFAGLVAYDELLAHPPERRHSIRSTQSSARRRIRSQPRSSRASSRASRVPSSRGSVAVKPAETEVVRVEVEDKPTGVEVFEFDKMVIVLLACNEQDRTADGGIRMRPFLVACTSICEFIHVFGRATSFAASTVTGYFASIDKKLATWPPAPGSTLPGDHSGSAVALEWKEQGLRTIVEREVNLGVAMVGGKKNPSVCRCLVRLLWFIEFVAACLQRALIENTDENCAPGASKAYEESLGLRHPWIIRKGVLSALGSLPSRSAILRSLNLHERTTEDATKQLQLAQTHMDAILKELKGLIEEHNLMDVK